MLICMLLQKCFQDGIWGLSLFFPDIPMFEMYSLLSGRATVLTPEKHPRAEGRQKETVTYRNGQRHFVEYSKKFS